MKRINENIDEKNSMLRMKLNVVEFSDTKLRFQFCLNDADIDVLENLWFF